ncbi:MAG TPA: ribosome small subunit-dependent GTPase A, partial [Gemmatales bacterium]|nr:ribosome small subunit-dependent GTPase A [Gemmatales bacterium]
KKKIRVDFRKNRSKPPREQRWTQRYLADGLSEDEQTAQERVRARGELSRKRTIVADVDANTDASAPAGELLAVDLTQCEPGRVFEVRGLHNVLVAPTQGPPVSCAVRRVLRTLSLEDGSVVAVGDRVWFRRAPTGEGMIEKVEPRYGVLTRESRGKEQVLVANVDQMVIVASLAEPNLKPHLIDRYLVAACRGRIHPIICLNKCDLVDPAAHVGIVGMYAQLGFPVYMTSTKTGQGLDDLRRLIQGRETVFAGQSGVGKASLLNAMEPGLELRTSEVSEMNQKGRHTTTTATLIGLKEGGWVVDTPGVRAFGLWQIVPQELDGDFPEFRAHVSACRFPGCTHIHEAGCGVKRALDRGWIAIQRYESYLDLYHGGMDDVD